MKTKFLGLALAASVATIAQANPGSVHRGGGGFHAGTGGFHGRAVAHSAPAVHAPMRAGGFLSFQSAAMRAHGRKPLFSGPPYSSVGKGALPSAASRRPFHFF